MRLSKTGCFDVKAKATNIKCIKSIQKMSDSIWLFRRIKSFAVSSENLFILHSITYSSEKKRLN